MIRALDPKLNPATAEIQALRNQLGEREKQIVTLEVSLNYRALFIFHSWTQTWVVRVSTASVWAGQTERVRGEDDRHGMVQQGTLGSNVLPFCPQRPCLTVFAVYALRVWTSRKWRWNRVWVAAPRPGPPSPSCPSNVKSLMHPAGGFLSTHQLLPPSSCPSLIPCFTLLHLFPTGELLSDLKPICSRWLGKSLLSVWSQPTWGQRTLSPTVLLLWCEPHPVKVGCN